MQVWVDVYDASGNRLGEGPVTTVTYAQVSRYLDKIGRVVLRVAGGDYRALSLLTNERRVKIWYDNGEGKRLLGQGIIRQPRYSEDGSTIDLSVDGNDILDELTRINTLLGREYDTQTIPDVLADLVGLVSGWSYSTDEEDGIDALFNGSSVWKALVAIADENDLHVRLSDTETKIIEMGSFGDDSGLRIVKAYTAANAAAADDTVAILQRPEITFDSARVVNRIYPYGGGEGTAKLTLASATLSTPYTIQTTTGPNGETVYYLEDEDSIDEFGVIEKVLSTDISPFANTNAATIRAANLLYRTSRRYLRQSSSLQRVYRVTVKGLTVTVKPGQTVRFTYKGEAYDSNGHYVTWLDVDADLWVLSVAETVTGDGLTTTFELSNIDRVVKTDEDVIISTIDQVQVDRVTIRPYPFFSENTYLDSIQADQTGSSGIEKFAEFKVEFDDHVLSLDSVIIRWKTRPLFSQCYVQPAFNTYHYAVFVSDNYPSNLTLEINGVDVTSDFGGPWASPDVNSAVDEEFDITDYILDAGFQNEHTIVFKAGTLSGVRNTELPGHTTAAGVFASHGWIEANFRIAGTRQAY